MSTPLPVKVAASGTVAVASSSWFRTAMMSLGLMNDPALSTLPTPGMLPPPAPKTAPKMQTWSTDDVGEAYAQKQVQYESDRAAVEQNSGAAPSNTPNDFTPPPPPDTSLSAWLVAAIALGGVAGISLLLPAGRYRR